METQESVVAWYGARFPGESAGDKVKMLMEEATELAVASGEVALREVMHVVEKVWGELGHLPKGQEHVASGIADVQIALYAIASAQGMDVQTCLDDKMRDNRQRIGA